MTRRHLIIGAMTLAAKSVTTTAVFPTVQASDLNKREITLPGALEGEVNLVLIAFAREQQKELDTWLAVLPGIKARSPRFAYYECPVISRLNPMARWFIDNGMRGGLPDHQQRARTITLYLDKEAFRHALQIASEKQIYALSINRSGKVLWRTEGVATPDKQKSLEEYLLKSAS